MPTPTEKEILKKKQDLEGFLKKLDDEGRIKENIAVSMLRSSIRQAWMRAPNKLAALLLAMEPDLDPNTRTKWLYRCAIYDKLYKLADVEVDHIEGEHSFKCAEDFQNYWDKVLMAPVSSLQVLSKEAHAIKTYAERYGLSWEEAESRKKVIAKGNQPVADQKKELISYGFKATEVSNAVKREAAYLQLLEERKI